MAASSDEADRRDAPRTPLAGAISPADFAKPRVRAMVLALVLALGGVLHP